MAPRSGREVDTVWPWMYLQQPDPSAARTRRLYRQPTSPLSWGRPPGRCTGHRNPHTLVLPSLPQTVDYDTSPRGLPSSWRKGSLYLRTPSHASDVMWLRAINQSKGEAATYITLWAGRISQGCTCDRLSHPSGHLAAVFAL